MRILMITPHRFPEVSGNATDVARIAAGLEGKGHQVTVVRPEEAEAQRDGMFEVIHAFHAHKARIALTLKPGTPYIVTMTGTDYNHDLDNPEKEKELVKVLLGAGRVTFLNLEAEERVRGRIPGLEGKTMTIRRGCEEAKRSDADFRKDWGAQEGVVYTMVGGIRRVKNNLYPIPLLKRLREEGLDIRYVMVGPVLEKPMQEALLKSLESHHFVTYAGCVVHAEMEGVYRASDVIVNASISEGDSNAISEAKCSSKPVLASDVAGNRQNISDGEDGYLFSGDEEFLAKARMLAADKGLRERLGKKAKENQHPNEDEVEEYLKAYCHAVALEKDRPTTR